MWSALYSFGAFTFGTVLTRISSDASVALIAVAVVSTVGSLVMIGRRMSKLEEKAELAYPGPIA